MIAFLLLPIASLLCWMAPEPASSSHDSAAPRLPRVIVYAGIAEVTCGGCTGSEGTEGVPDNAVKDVDLQCCAQGSVAGAITTSGYGLGSGKCLVKNNDCDASGECSYTVTLTIQMGCHQELWVTGRPGQAPGDAGRIVAGISIPISIKAECVKDKLGGTKNDTLDILIQGVPCTQGGAKELVGRWHPVLKCSQCVKSD